MEYSSMNARLLNIPIFAFVCIVLSACSDDDSSKKPTVETETTALDDEPIQTSAPVFSEAQTAQKFVLDEDSRLRGQFYRHENELQASATIKSLPEHGLLTLEPGGEIFVYTPEADFWGSDSFEYQTFGGVALVAQFEVLPVADAPMLSAEIPRVAAQGQRFTHQLLASDGDGDVLSYHAEGLPRWLNLESTSGLLSGFPTQDDIGISDDVVFSVDDGTGLSDQVSSVRFEVIDINDAPTVNVTQVPTELLARETVTVRLYPDDADGERVTLDVEKNDFIAGTASGGSVKLTASDVNEVMDVNIVVKATDVRGRISREILPFTIYPLTASGRGITLAGVKDGRAVHVVIFGDGYTVDQEDLFRQHANTMIDNLREDTGIVRHFDALSFHMIYNESNSTNADDDETVDARDTYFDSTYGCRSIKRLICANDTLLLDEATDEYPYFDQVILLVNDSEYGGSGNSGSRIAMTSAYHPEIALHEMGHSQANLADEYVENLIVETSGIPAFVEGKHANVTAITDPLLVPWAHWIEPELPLPQLAGDAGVGIFEGGLYRGTGVYRPTFDSRMRSYGSSFGPVNSERWILSVYEDTNGGVRGFLPSTRFVEIAEGESQIFVVSPIFAEDTQDVEWVLDGKKLEPELDPNSVTITPDAGRHVLELIVSDISGAVRMPPPHPGVFTWTWVVEVQ